MLTKTQIRAIADRHSLPFDDLTWNRIRGFSKDLLLEHDKQQREQIDTLVQCTKTEMKLSDLKHEVEMDNAARAHAKQYLDLTEAMGYHSGDDGMDGPEEYAARLLAENASLKEQITTLKAQLAYENAAADVPDLDLDAIAEKHLESASDVERFRLNSFKKDVLTAHQQFTVRQATAYALRFRAIMNILGYTPDNYGKVSPNQYAINLVAENASLKDRVKFLEDPTTGSWVNGDDYRRGLHELDVILNGEDGAAKNPSLIDILSQLHPMRARLDHPLLKYIPNGHQQPTTATQSPVNLKAEIGLGPLPNPQVGLSLKDIESLAESGFGTPPTQAPATMNLSLEDLGVLADTARRNGTTEAFYVVALQWCKAANAEVLALREQLDAATMKNVVPQNSLDQWVPYEEEAPGFREWWDSIVAEVHTPVYAAYKWAKRSWDAAVARMHTAPVLTEEQLNTGLKLHHLNWDKDGPRAEGFCAGARWAHSLKPGTSPVALPYEGDVEDLYAGLHSISKCFESSGVVYEKDDMEEGETSYYGTILSAMNFVSAYRKDDEEEEVGAVMDPASSALHESAYDLDGWLAKLPKGSTVYLAPKGSIQTPVIHEVLEESHRLRTLITVNAEQYPTDMGELAMAGSCYSRADKDEAPSQIWPWHWKLWDPKDEYSNRITAAALLLLEAERVSSTTDNDLN